MNTTEPVDYQAAIDQFRKSELDPETTVQAPFIQPKMNKCVDYEAIVKAWDKQITASEKIHHKENHSHDPEQSK